MELPPGAESVAHDHTDDGAEDVYAVLAGSGWVIVDGEEVPAQPGTFIAVAGRAPATSAPAPPASPTSRSAARDGVPRE